MGVWWLACRQQTAVTKGTETKVFGGPPVMAPPGLPSVLGSRAHGYTGRCAVHILTTAC